MFNMKKNILILFVFLIALAFFQVRVHAFTLIEGDMVYVDDSKIYLSAEPHTITSSDEVVFNLVSKVFEGDVDILFGINTDYFKIRSAHLYKPRTWNETYSYTCPTDIFNYTLNPNHFWCWKNHTTTDSWYLSILREEDFEWGDLPSKTTYWNETFYSDWLSMSDKFNSIDFDFQEWNKFFYLKEVNVEKDKNYILKAFIEVLPDLDSYTHKYIVCVKPSDETFQEAKQNDHIYCLDPWYSSIYGKKRSITFTNNSAYSNTTVPFNISFDAGAGCDDYSCIEMVDDSDNSTLSFWRREYKASTWLYGYVKTSNNVVYVYYGNTSFISDNQNGKETFHFFEDWDVDAVNNTKWANISSPEYTISNGLLNFTLTTGINHDKILAAKDTETVTGDLIYEVLHLQKNMPSGSGNQYLGFGLTSGNDHIWWSTDDAISWMSMYTAIPDEKVQHTVISSDTSTSEQTADDADIIVWNVIKVEYVGSTNSSWYHNGTLGDTTITTNVPANTIDYNFSIFDGTGGGTPDLSWMMIDWILARDYLNPDPPPVSLGGEEGASGNAPLWSSNTSSTPTNYSPTTYSTFNITWGNGSANTIVNTSFVNFTSNYSGSEVNYNMTLISGDGESGVYGYQVILGAGTYYWKSGAVNNASTPFSNTSDTWTFTISQASNIMDMWINGSLNQNVSQRYTVVNVSAQACDGATVCTVYLYGGNLVALNNSGGGGNPAWTNYTNSSLIEGDSYNFSMNATGSANYSSNTSLVTFWYTYASLLSVDVLDEQTETGITFNITLQNDTFSFTDYNRALFTANSTNMPYGDVTVIVWANNYGQRNYYREIEDTSSEFITAYLVPDSIGQDVLFTIKDTLDTLITGAEINVSKILSGGMTVVAQGISDDTGRYSFSLQTMGNYNVTIYKSGYLIKNVILIPSLTSYTIYLVGDIAERPSYWDFYRTLYSNCTFANSTRLLNCTWVDVSGHVVNTTLEVLTMNTSGHMWTLCSNTSTNSSGAFYCNFGTANNQTFYWSMWMDTGSNPSSLLAASGSWTDALAIGVLLGVTGILVSMIIIIFSGFLGVQMGSPIVTVIMTVLGVGASMILGFLSIGTAGFTILLGLALSGGILIWKMRSGEKT